MTTATIEGDAPRTRLGRIAVAVETWAVVVIIAVMAVLPALEAGGRLFLHRGIPGSAIYVQHLTLWIGFLGALLATSAGKHLSLATGDLIPEGRLRRASRIYTGSISAGVTALLAYASYRQLVLAEIPRHSYLAGGIPDWWSECIMPAALALMAIRFVWRASDGWAGRAVALAALAGCCSLGLLSGHAHALIWPGIALILFGILLGTPVFVAMAGIAMLLFFAGGDPIASVPTETYRLIANATMPAIPLLTAAGYILAEGGASKRLVWLSRLCVGWMPGGMALMVTLVCAGFTTFTGGSGVTILALGGLMLPMLLSEGYPEDFSLGLVTSSGSLGLLFPPSLPVILYAIVAGVSVEDLYIAGFLPCLLLVVLVALYAIFVGFRTRKEQAPVAVPSPIKGPRDVLALLCELAIPVVVIAAIFTGFSTMVEASAIAVVLAVLSQSVVSGDLHPVRDLPRVLRHGATLVGAVLILLGVAMGLTSYLVDAEVPAAVLAWTKAHIDKPYIFLLALNGALLVLGSVLEIYSAIVILAPLLAPMAKEYGVDPLHLGIIFLANLELGFLFPPMGLNLILSSSRFSKPLTRLYRVALPFLFIMSAGVLLITYFPPMTNGFLKLVKRAPAAQRAPTPPPDRD